jgi:GxxExxY protein
MRRMDNYLNDRLTERIIGLAMRVHRELGPGFLESVYRRALSYELRRAAIGAREEVRINVYYDNVVVGEFVADILVENAIILEPKAVESLNRVHEIQTVNYLTATGLPLGLLINFGAPRLQFKRKHGRPRGMPRSERDEESSAESVSQHPVNPVKVVDRPDQREDPHEAQLGSDA